MPYVPTHAKTQDLLALLRECQRLGARVDDLTEECKFLLRYGALARYPGSGFEAAQEQGETARAYALKVHARMPKLLPHSTS
ncbi:MAG: HEPN domain-containing protein [Gemmatimonadaceae bacterium]